MAETTVSTWKTGGEYNGIKSREKIIDTETVHGDFELAAWKLVQNIKKNPKTAEMSFAEVFSVKEEQDGHWKVVVKEYKHDLRSIRDLKKGQLHRHYRIDKRVKMLHHLCLALAELHNAGIVHKYINPRSILRTTGKLLLSNFVHATVHVPKTPKEEVTFAEEKKEDMRMFGIIMYIFIHDKRGTERTLAAGLKVWKDDPRAEYMSDLVEELTNKTFSGDVNELARHLKNFWNHEKYNCSNR
eukprot:747300_1